MDPALRDRLVGLVGARHVLAGDAVRPATLDQLRAVLAACADAGAAVLPRGAPGAGDAVAVDASRLTAVVLDADVPLLRAGGAATWEAVRDAASKSRLAVAGLPAVSAATVAETIESGEIAARTLAGIVLLTWGGVLIEAAGRTLKDVVGYNVAGLTLGSGGRLGMVAGAVLRTEPVDARTPALPGPGPWRDEPVVDIVAAFAG